MGFKSKVIVWLMIAICGIWVIQWTWLRFAPLVPDQIAEFGTPAPEFRFLNGGQVGICQFHPPPYSIDQPILHGPMQYWDLKGGQKVREQFSTSDDFYPLLRNSNAILLRGT